MLTTVRGIYRRGKVELVETPVDLPDEANVIVTFLQSSSVDLRERGIDEDQAAELRGSPGDFLRGLERP